METMCVRVRTSIICYSFRKIYYLTPIWATVKKCLLYAYVFIQDI